MVLDIYFQWGKIYLRDVSGSLISESQLCNTLVNGNSPKVSGYFFLFLYLVFIMSLAIPKMITDAVHLITSA